MPRSPFGFVLPLLLSLAVAAPLSLASPEAAAETAKAKASAPKKAAAKGFHPVHAAVLMDARTGRVIEAKNADVVTYPASLTKMMTLLLTFEALERGALRPDQELPVSAHAANQKPSRLGVVPGGTIRVEDAVLALTVKSANDVAAVLAEALGGSEAKFAEQMTAKARALGMTKTTFRNASGLPHREQRTTARDMAKLSRAVVNLPARHYANFGRTSFVWNGTAVTGHNRLIGKVDGYDGIKTGFVNTSGFNLAGSATRNGQRLIAVVLGGSTAAVRDREVADLLEKGFRSAAPKQAVAAR
jgi:D-alanyl-D-alanine carboxypeptidase